MAVTLKRIKQVDKLTTVPNNVDLSLNKPDGTTVRAELSDILSLSNLPAGALERLVDVADQTARYALTTATVQLGDTVRQIDTGIMYVVVDESNLNNASGYKEYVAGIAAKATADESGNNIKSNYASSLEISNGSVVLKNKNGTALSTQSLPSTVGTFYGVETTVSGNTQAKTATVTNNDFVLVDGITVVIQFVNTNSYEATVNNPITLNVNNTGAKSIIVKSNTLPLGDNPMIFGRANYYNTYVYDGTYWVWQACSYKGTEKNNIFTGTTSAWEQLSNAEQDEYDIINITDDVGSYDILQTYVGTRQAWNALSASEQAKYIFVEFTDDGGYGNSYDIPYNSSNVGTALDNINSALTAYKTPVHLGSNVGVISTSYDITNYDYIGIEFIDDKEGNKRCTGHAFAAKKQIIDMFTNRSCARYDIIGANSSGCGITAISNSSITVTCFNANNVVHVYGY